VTTLNRLPPYKNRGGGAPFFGTRTAEKANRGLCCTPDASGYTRKSGQ
jgi:hypothetical protein